MCVYIYICCMSHDTHTHTFTHAHTRILRHTHIYPLDPKTDKNLN